MTKIKTILAGCLFMMMATTLVANPKDEKRGINYSEISKIEIDRQSLSDAQQMCLDIVSSIDESSIDTASAAPDKPKYWKNGILTQIALSQVSLTNWAEGGTANVSLNALIDAHANYSKNNMIFENRLKLSYGFIQSFDNEMPYAEQFKKSDDKIQLDSKWGYKMVDRLYFSALLNFRTQFTPTNEWVDGVKNLKSKIMAPGYISVGLGINYKPFNSLSINLSPVTGNFVVVTEESLREMYGNAINQAVRTELGAQLKIDFAYAYKTFKIGTNLTLFSDYLNNPENIKVYWDLDASLALNRFFTLTLRTNLIYDDVIKITDPKTGVAAPRVQFKEIVGLGFTYTFGQYVKAS